eukprot:PhM_4_TR18763/c1_g1_i2/m.4311
MLMKLCIPPSLVPLFALTAMVLLLAQGLDVAHAVDVVFGQSAPLTGSAIRYNAGLLAAFKASNDQGGVYGRMLKLRTLDDKGNATLTRQNVATLLSMPDVLGIVAPIGTDSTAAAVEVAGAADVPVIGGMTGEASLRFDFHKFAVNVRAGYHDEIMAMFYVFNKFLLMKRVCIAYQDDAFGRGLLESFSERIQYLDVNTTSCLISHPADVNFASYDYNSVAQKLVAYRAQIFVYFTSTAWSNPVVDAYHALAPNSNMIFMTGSWNGEDNRNYFMSKGYDPSKLIVTQVTPRPLSADSYAAYMYRNALMNDEGTLGMSQFDFVSFEGFLTGSLVVEIIRRTYYLHRADVLQAIYGTRLFVVYDQLAGPFSADCLYNIPSKTGRASTCFCSQGLRYVEATVLDQNYQYERLVGITYDIRECWDTGLLVLMPLQIAVPTPPATSDIEYPHLISGIGSDPMITATMLQMNLTDPTVIDIVPQKKIQDQTYLIATLGVLPSEPQSDFIVFSGLTASTVHAGQLGGVMPFRRERIFVLPTLQQELYSLASLVRAMPSLSGGVHLLVRSSSVPFGVDYYVGLVRASLRSHGYVGALSTGTFSDASSLSSAIPATSSSAPLPSTLVLVVGLGGGSELRAVSERVSLSGGASVGCVVGVLFSEAAAAWSGVSTSNCSASSVCGGGLSRVRVTSNLPLWTSSNASAFSAAYQRALSSSSPSDRRHPLTAVGYLVAEITSFLLEESSESTSAAILDTLYKFSVVTVQDIAFGPFDDTVCGSEVSGSYGLSCECNVGPRTLFHYSLGMLLLDEPDNLFSGVGPHGLTFASCEVLYVPEAEDSDGTNLVAVLAGCIGGIIVLLAAFYVITLFRHQQNNKRAPRTPPMCFLLTDVQSSTKLWEAFPDLMPAAVETHHRVIRRLIEEYDAYE